MLAVERRKQILQKLKASGSVTVSELRSVYQVSEETIRRDLSRMESEGLLDKTYGGAFIKGGMHREIPFSLRNVAYLQAKEAIGRRCASMVEDGDTVFLDASTTALHVAGALLDRKNLVVISNALAVAYTLSESPDIKVISIGGTLRKTSLTCTGRAAEDAISTYFADKLFFSCDGVHRHNGVTDANENEAEIRKAMLRQSERRFLIADNTKFGRTSFALIDKFDNIDAVIVDELSEDWTQFFADRKIDLYFGLGFDSDSLEQRAEVQS